MIQILSSSSSPAISTSFSFIFLHLFFFNNQDLYSIIHARDLMQDKSDSILRLMAVQLEKVRLLEKSYCINKNDFNLELKNY